MTISATLMKAILAMDSYNRGYNEGLQITTGNVIGLQVGNYTITQQSDILNGSAEVDASFYAIAYQYNGETVISYRGTDSLIDPITGWPVGAGAETAPQATMSFDFYNTVDALTTNTISVTGHSMGGGLAGLVAGVYGQDGLLFDSMECHEAAQDYAAFAQLPAPDFTGVTAMAMQDEIMSEPFNPWGESSIQVSLGDDVNLTQLAPDWVSLHDMGSLVIRMFAGTTGAEENAFGTGWKSAAKYFWPVMYDAGFAASIGITANGGRYAADQAMRSMIAYSAIDEGTRVYGDTGIRAFYNDANDFGGAIAAAGTGISTAMIDNAEGISQALVEYAALLAKEKILQASSYATTNAALNGVLTYGNAVNDHTLTVNYLDAKWSFMTGAPMESRAALFATNVSIPLLGTGVDAAMTQLWGNNTATAIERVVFARDNAGTTVIDDGFATQGKATLFVGGSGNATVVGTSDKDLIVTKDGQDIVDAGPACERTQSRAPRQRRMRVKSVPARKHFHHRRAATPARQQGPVRASARDRNEQLSSYVSARGSN